MGWIVQIFFEQKLVFLAVPKAGSTSCESALRQFASVEIISPPKRRHMTSRRFQRTLGVELEREHNSKFETIAILRDPLERLASWFKYRTRQSRKKCTAGMTFEDFVGLSLRDCPPPEAKIGSQDRFVQSTTGEILIDHLFCIENPEPFIAFASDRFQYPVELERLNESPTADTALSEESKALLYSCRKREFELYSKVRDAGHLRSRVKLT